jgi:hypothetical protein
MKLFKISRTPYTWRFYLLPRVKIHWIRQKVDEWHTHPWDGFSIIFGWYWEQLDPNGPWKLRYLFNKIGAHRPHRTRGNCLTLFIHGKRTNEDWFWGDKKAPWRGVQTNFTGDTNEDISNDGNRMCGIARDTSSGS